MKASQLSNFGIVQLHSIQCTSVKVTIIMHQLIPFSLSLSVHLWLHSLQEQIMVIRNSWQNHILYFIMWSSADNKNLHFLKNTYVQYEILEQAYKAVLVIFQISFCQENPVCLKVFRGTMTSSSLLAICST